MKRFLVEIAHPGHVHFFKIPIRILRDEGWEPVIYARDKAETFSLLDAEGLEYSAGPGGDSNFNKLIGLLPEALDIYRLTKKNHVRVLAGIGAIHASISSRISGVPCICFADTEHSIEQAMIYVPNCKRIYTPRAFQRNFGKKQRRYAGYHELCYLHPNYFKPDSAALEEKGLLDRGSPIVVRMIKWDATHDFGIKRIQWEKEFVSKFSKDYDLVISSEGVMPKQFEQFENPLPPHEYHNLLSYSRLYVGPGATTASECAMLGTPAVYTNPLALGYLDELEAKYGLVFQHTDASEIISAATNVLASPKTLYEDRRANMLKDNRDVARFVSDAIINEAIH
jgi:predicted glycosyltransferase